MKNNKYHKDLGETSACTNRVMEGKRGLGQRGGKGNTKDCFIFGSLFLSTRSDKYAMDAGVYIIGMVKINTKGFC